MATTSRKSKAKNPVRKAAGAVNEAAADAGGAVNKAAGKVAKGVKRTVNPKSSKKKSRK